MPEINRDNTVEQMKADLWEHIIKVIKDVPQQLIIYGGLEYDKDDQCEIVDIQFAMDE